MISSVFWEAKKKGRTKAGLQNYFSKPNARFIQSLYYATTKEQNNLCYYGIPKMSTVYEALASANTSDIVQVKVSVTVTLIKLSVTVTLIKVLVTVTLIAINCIFDIDNQKLNNEIENSGELDASVSDFFKYLKRSASTIILS
ncbi:hypothetical protein K501DRAFT_266219 [Backusella circina FSU 941]|nr:hypothetical protein K501DRAFT_266219 [Backusella circina FSU 941]